MKDVSGVPHPVGRINLRGADYYTIWIHIVVNGLYFGAACALFYKYVTLGPLETAVLIGLPGWLLGVYAGERLRRIHFDSPAGEEMRDGS